MASEIILSPGDGKKVLFLGNEMILKVVSKDTGGVFSLCEFTMQAGFGGPPPHIHQEHEETFYVLEGQLRFRIAGREIEAPAGALAHVPRGVAHTFWNPGEQPAKMLAVFTPAGYESYFEDVSRAFPAGVPPDPSRLTEIMARYDTVPAGPPPGVE